MSRKKSVAEHGTEKTVWSRCGESKTHMTPSRISNVCGVDSAPASPHSNTSSGVSCEFHHVLISSSSKWGFRGSGSRWSARLSPAPQQGACAPER